MDVSQDDRRHRHAVHVYVNDSFIGLHRLRGSRDSRAKTRKRTHGERGALKLIAPFFRLARRRRRVSKRERNLSNTRPFSRRLLKTSGELRCGSYSIFPYKRLSVLSNVMAT